MTIQFGLSQENCNTQYAPLGVLLATYKDKKVLKPLEKVKTTKKSINFSMIDKIEQVLVSILAGCETISEVNTKLKGDPLAKIGSWRGFADQSTLSLALDALTLMNLEQLRSAICQIRQRYGKTASHDWRGFLWLDYDLSGLPSGGGAKGSEKGYFSEKKRDWAAIGPCECD